MDRNDYVKYKEHPRIIELRLVLTFKNLVDNYGYENAYEIFEVLAKLFGVNFTLLTTVLNNEYNIRRTLKTDRIRYYQDVIFMGFVYGETKYYMANHYSSLSYDKLYRGQGKNIEEFLNDEWLSKLNDNVTICGASSYKFEVVRFLRSYEYFTGVVGNVSIS